MSTEAFAKHVVVYLKVTKKALAFPSIQIERNSGNLEEYLVDVYTPLRRFGLHDFFVQKAYSKAFNQMEKDIGKPSLVHIHVRSHLTKHALPTVLNWSIPIVLTEHFSFYHRGIKSLSEAAQNSEKQAIKHFLQHTNVKHIMPVSEELKSILTSKFGASIDETTVIPNIADECFKPSLFETANRIRIALVAGWHFPKNPIAFLQAIALLPIGVQNKLHIDFIGHGSQIDDVRNHISTHLPKLDITMHGYLTKPEISSYLQKSDFFCHPTDQENLPTVIAEALCCGTPVLSMNVNGIPEMVNSRNGILVDAKDVNALKEGIVQMIERSNSFDREAIALEAQKRYGKNEIGAQIQRIYQSVLSL